jgi:hypothetical protein
MSLLSREVSLCRCVGVDGDGETSVELLDSEDLED